MIAYMLFTEAPGHGIRQSGSLLEKVAQQNAHLEYSLIQGLL